MNSSNVKLLGFFPLEIDERSKNDMWIIQCRSMFRAAIILSQQYNITFQNEFLSYEEIITNDNIMITIDNTCKKVSTSNIIGFVGPAYSNEARYLSSFAYQLGIISISYSATSPDLSTIDNEAFYRVVPSDENTVLGITILFQQYNWKSSIIIYQNDEYGYNGMKLLKEKFNEISIKTRDIIKYDMNQENFQNILINSLSRIIILWADEKSTIIILKKALEENLIGTEFIWILTTTISLDHFNQKEKEKLIGILIIEPIKGDFVNQTINITLLNDAYEIWKHYQPDTFPGDNNVNSYALFTFDATWTFILILQKLCSMNISCLQFFNISNCYYRQFINSKQYYDIMKSVSFLGVSGDIKFSNKTTDRIGNSYYIIKNIQPLNEQLNNIGYLPVLKWDLDSIKWTSYKNQSNDIVWPSLSKNIPADYKLIRGEELRMGIMEAPPFIILKNSTATYSGMTSNFKRVNITEFDGFFKDIILYLQNRMGFIPVIVLAKPTTQNNELVEGVANNLYDTVMKNIAITANRTSIVDFSISLIPSSIRVLVRKPKSIHFDLLFFLKPFSWKLWLVILFTILYAAILIWYFERRNNTKSDNTVKNNGIRKSIRDTLYIMLNRTPYSNISTDAGRFLTFGLYILQIILFAIYTASLLSFIIIQNVNPTISGIDDIKTGKIAPHRIGIIEGSVTEYTYLNTISHGKEDYYPVKTIGELYTSLINGDIDAALWSNHSSGYYVNNIYCDLMIVGAEFSHISYNLPIRKDWLYKADLDSNILSLIESGEYDRISTKWFAKRSCSRTDAFNTKSITLETTGGLFITFLSISIISILIHFWSIIGDFRQNIDVNTSRIHNCNPRNEPSSSVSPSSTTELVDHNRNSLVTSPVITNDHNL